MYKTTIEVYVAVDPSHWVYLFDSEPKKFRFPKQSIKNNGYWAVEFYERLHEQDPRFKDHGHTCISKYFGFCLGRQSETLFPELTWEKGAKKVLLEQK